MNTTVKLLLAGALALGLGACEKKGEPGDSGTSAPTAHNDHGHEHSQPAAPGTAPAQPATQWTQATSEGALRLFIGAMAEGRFSDAAVLVDQGSESYDDFIKLNESLDPATANPNVDKATLEMVRGFMSGPWNGATLVLVSEEAPRAEYTVTLNNGREKKIELNQFEGNWYVLASKSLLSPGTPDPAPAEGAPQSGN